MGKFPMLRWCTSSLLRRSKKASFSSTTTTATKIFPTRRASPFTTTTTPIFLFTAMSCKAPLDAPIPDGVSSAVVVTTSAVALVSGFLLGVYSIRGYLISPALTAERDANYKDPVESEESDIDEDDTILDHAPNWANGEEADRRQGLRASTAAAATSSSSAKPKKDDASKNNNKINPNEECKLVLVVRTDLGMTKGKIAAQAGHATLACYKSLSRAAAQDGPNSRAAQILKQWEKRGQAKIAVQVKSEDEMLALQGIARSLDVTAEVIADAGRTQIESGSLTVLGVGPAPKSEVDKVTGGLKLL